MPDSRLDDNGLPQDYSKEELRHLMVEENGYLSEDFDRVIEEFHKTKGLFRSFHFTGFLIIFPDTHNNINEFTLFLPIFYCVYHATI